MKKQTFYGILIGCILSIANVFAEHTFNLTPKLEPGDAWKMQNTFYSKDFKMNFNMGESMRNFSQAVVNDTKQGLRIKTNWQMECMGKTDTSIQIKSTLLQLQIMEGMGSSFHYFDSSYPLNLSDEIKVQIDSIIGKHCITDLNFNTDSVSILTHTFNKKSSNVQMFSFMNKKQGSVLFSYKMTFSAYNFVGPDFLSLLFKAWTGVIPNKEISENELWSIPTDNKTENAELSITHKNNHTLTIAPGDSTGEFIKIFTESNLLAEVQLNNLIKSYTYAYNSRPNTLVTGSYSDKNTKGSITFESWFPVSSKKWTANIVDGKFELPMDLAEASTFRIKYNGQVRPFFIAPGSNVHLSWNDHNQFTASGDGAADYTAMRELLNLHPHIAGVSANKNVVEIKTAVKAYQKEVNKVLKQYQDSLTSAGLSKLKTDRDYTIAERFLTVLEDMEREKFKEKDSTVLAQMDNSANYMIGYLDSISTLGNLNKASVSYHTFLSENLILQQRLFLKDRGRRRDRDNLDENLFFARIQYIGYPQYYCIYQLLKQQLLDGNTKQADKHLDEFYDLPIAPNFSKNLFDLRQQIKTIEVGQPFPYHLLLNTVEKPVSIPKNELTIVEVNKSLWMNDNTLHLHQQKELSRIIRENPRLNHINYVAVLSNEYEGKFKETPSSDSVTIIYKYIQQEKWPILDPLQLIGNSRIFLLDKGGIILDNNVGYIRKNSANNLEEDLDLYYTAQKENQESGISKNVLLLIIALAILFGLLTWGTIKVRSRSIAKREAKKRQLKELELKAIRSQMNPHFIFNAMGSIQNLMNQNKIKEANIYLASFAKLMRLVLNTSNKKLVSLSDEISLIKHYLSLEQLRIDFQYTIQVENTIVPENEEIPGMLIQPFVENAVIHGITPKGGGNIWVEFVKKNNFLNCIITDDGVGIDTSSPQNGNGVAMNLAQKRVDLLNSGGNNKVNLIVTNRGSMESKKQGTIIKLIIPIH